MDNEFDGLVRRFTLVPPHEIFPGLPALAARLGVQPNKVENGLALVMNDGTKYDAFALINAFLDRIDHLTKETM